MSFELNSDPSWRTSDTNSANLLMQGRAGDLANSISGNVNFMRNLTNAGYPVNLFTVNPTTVNTPMIQNDAFYQYAGGSAEQMAALFQSLNAIPVPWVEPIDISNAVLYLASDESRYVTGLTLWVDAGLGTKVGTG